MYIAGTNGIETGDIYFKEVGRLALSGSGEARAKLNRDRIKKFPIHNAKLLLARIDHSRWIVDCPSCNGAEFMFEDKLFFCSVCKNSFIEGKVLKVIIPQARKDIEDILKIRPIKNRNWFPNETVQDLQNENIKYGGDLV